MESKPLFGSSRNKVVVTLMVLVVVISGLSFTSGKGKNPGPFTGQWKVAGYMHRTSHGVVLSVELDKVIYYFTSDSTGTISRNDSITSSFTWVKRKKVITITDNSGPHQYRFIDQGSSLELHDLGSGNDERGNPYSPNTWGIAFLR